MVVQFTIALTLMGSLALAQGSFPPQAGVPGSAAIPADSSAFRDWAVSCSVKRGLRQIDQPDSGYASTGSEVYALGKADAPLTVSLGDSGVAVLTFSAPIYDGPGPDFAVFENGFGSGSDAFLELAFVEVSSDGVNYFRFPAVSEIQDSIQKGSFENTDASMIHNLAGKYIVNYGVPFDLEDLPDTTMLDKQNITHVRIVDVVGNIDPAYASADAFGKRINDPWPTNFPQSGFDLDAVGVINSKIPLAVHSVRETGTKNAWLYDLHGRPIDPGYEATPFTIMVGQGTKTIRR